MFYHIDTNLSIRFDIFFPSKNVCKELQQKSITTFSSLLPDIFFHLFYDESLLYSSLKYCSTIFSSSRPFHLLVPCSLLYIALNLIHAFGDAHTIDVWGSLKMPPCNLFFIWLTWTLFSKHKHHHFVSKLWRIASEDPLE